MRWFCVHTLTFLNVLTHCCAVRSGLDYFFDNCGPDLMRYDLDTFTWVDLTSSLNGGLALPPASALARFPLALLN